MTTLTEDAKRDRTFWRGMYLISFVIGTVLPVASIIAAGAMTDDGLSPRPDQAGLLALYLVWSAATLVSVLGTTSAAWIVISTGEKLGIDRSRGYLRGMFLLAFTIGGVVPIAALIAVGVMSPTMAMIDALLLIVVAWGGMLAVCIAGVCYAIWLVRTAALKLIGDGRRAGALETEYHAPYARGAADVR
jgi:cytochrome bd-type quinol oxidase subunit 2